MDIEKQIELLQNNRHPNGLKSQATALSTLQAENEKLRAELEQVKRDLDAAVKCIKEIEDALNFQRMSAIGLRISEWCGKKED